MEWAGVVPCYDWELEEERWTYWGRVHMWGIPRAQANGWCFGPALSHAWRSPHRHGPQCGAGFHWTGAHWDKASFLLAFGGTQEIFVNHTRTILVSKVNLGSNFRSKWIMKSSWIIHLHAAPCQSIAIWKTISQRESPQWVGTSTPNYGFWLDYEMWYVMSTTSCFKHRHS